MEIVRLTTVAAAAALASASAAAQTVAPIVTENAYPPFVYVDESGALTGIYPAILAAAFARLEGYEVQVEPMPWWRALNQVERGAAFAVFPPYESSGAKRPFIDRYSEPIWMERLVLVCGAHVDVAERAAWPDDFHGLTVGANAGYIMGGDAFVAAVDAGAIALEEAPDAASNLRKLIAGRIDCYVNAAMAIEAGLAEIGATEADRAALAQVMILDENAANVGYSAAGAYPFKADFADALDAVLIEMRQSGEMARIAAEFFTR
jgi:polar amino acid transport system substrate-binding protein